METDIPGRSPTPRDPRERMQRVRVGLTGLAAVGLAIMVATAVATSVRDRASDTMTNAGPPAVVATVAGANAADAKSEPLAQLGVAPDTKDAAASPGKSPN